MKKLISLTLLSLIYITVYAQEFAVIKDKDGFVNVRKGKSSNSPTVGKLYSLNIFTCKPDQSDWWQIWYAPNAETGTPGYIEGFVHKSRISVLNNHVSVNPKNVYTDSCVFNANGLIVVIKKQAFHAKNQKLQYSKVQPNENTGRVLQKINGKHFWGTDGTMPKEVITGIRVVKNKEPIFIPRNAFDDLYQPNFKTLSVYFGPDNTMYIFMQNSDGAGAYAIFWIIKNNKFYKRYIDNSEA